MSVASNRIKLIKYQYSELYYTHGKVLKVNKQLEHDLHVAHMLNIVLVVLVIIAAII